MRRARRCCAVLGVLGATLLAAAPMAGRAGAQETVVFTGFTVLTASDGMGGTFGDPTAAPYPVAAGQVPHTQASLTTGPTGYALASTAWPGPLVANAGSLAVLLGAPKEARNANYGGRAEATSPTGDGEASLGPGMRARAKDNVAEATATVQDFASGPGVSTGSITTTVRNELEHDAVNGAASSLTSDISIAEGVITIDSVQTFATASSDGLRGIAGGYTVVNGLEINGHPATVDENGVRASDPALQPIQDNLLANLGIEMFVSKPRASRPGDPNASYRSGSLVVVWDFFDSGHYVIYTFGGSEAEAEAARGSLFQPPDLPLPTPPAGAPPAAPDAGGFAPSPPGTTPLSPTTTVPSTSGEVALEPVAFVRNLSIWPYILGTLFTAAAGIGLWRFREDAVERVAAAPCPNDRR